MRHFRGYGFVFTIILSFIFVGSTMCNTGDKASVKAGVWGPNENYVGSLSCKKCHEDVYNTYQLTPHFNTSAWVSEEVLNSTRFGEGEYYYTSNLSIRIQRTKEGMFQTAYKDTAKAASHRLDMLIGSGRRGHTFLFRSENQFYQLPLSWSTQMNQWVNSPGYPGDKVVFNRAVYVKCFECHASYAGEAPSHQGFEGLDSSQMALSISCETCHGPGKKHNEYHTKESWDKKAKFIVNTASLSRQQQMDACASCHSGLRENLKPPFSFVPGDKLDQFFKPAVYQDSAKALDVHGNQFGLLTGSVCFKQSLLLNCSSCHNVHAKETKNTMLFAQRCLTCHGDSKQACTLEHNDRQAMMNKCIDCHMPLQKSNQIFFDNNDSLGRISELIRTHAIGIYKVRSN